MAEKKKSQAGKPEKKGAPEEDPKAPVPLGEIEHGPSQLDSFLEQNIRKLIALVVLVALGFAIYVVVRELRETKRREAGSALLVAEDLGDYRDVIQGYSNTPAAATAMLELGKVQIADGQNSEGIATLREFISKHPKHPGVPSAQMLLANTLISDGETDEGSRLLNELVDTADPKARFISPFAAIRLGDLAFAEGKREEARQYYERANQLLTTGAQMAGQARIQIIQSRLDLVRVDEPVLVEPQLPVRFPLLPEDAPDNGTPEAEKELEAALKPPVETETTPPANNESPSPAPAPGDDVNNKTDGEPKDSSEVEDEAETPTDSDRTDGTPTESSPSENTDAPGPDQDGPVEESPAESP